MEATESFDLKIDSTLKEFNPKLFSELTIFKKELNKKSSNNLEFTLAYGVLLLYVNEKTSTEKKIAYLLNNKIAYYLVENNSLEEFLEAIQLMKEEQDIFLKHFPTLEDPKNTLEYLKNFEEIIENTVDNGFNYYKELVETTPII